MKTRTMRAFTALLLLFLCMGFAPPQTAQAQGRLTGGVLIHTSLPHKVCVGDSITINGGASVDYLADQPMPIAYLHVINLTIQASQGTVTPATIYAPSNLHYFSFVYTARTPGTENIVVTLNDGLAQTQERFEVEEKCDYDAFVTTVMHFSADTGDGIFRSITHVSGMGTMKRDRQGTEFYQGDGKWHLESNTLTKPSICVQYYSPPLINSGPFELDGHLADEGDEVDVILSFLPDMNKTRYHGKSICVDEDGDTGYGWSYASGGNPRLASKIEATFPVGGGTQSVELKGLGMEMVQSAGDLDYTATLTLIPR
ncbi:MAG TPA: hypothetical protein VIO36_03120 [Anaerolineaceae bacterium]